jgi:hypothetical protein
VGVLDVEVNGIDVDGAVCVLGEEGGDVGGGVNVEEADLRGVEGVEAGAGGVRRSRRAVIW